MTAATRADLVTVDGRSGVAGSRRGSQHGVLTEVAQAAGVSVATVSKVVHGRRDVGAATRARVEILLGEHGFVRPWERPPGVRRQIFVIFRDLSGPYTLEVARGIVEAAHAVDCGAVVGTTTHRSVTTWLDESAAADAAGLILVISRLTEPDQRRVIDQHIPVVLVDPLAEPSPEIPNVGVTNETGGRMAVEHLLGLGHRRIGMLAGRPSSVAGAARLAGYRGALADAGIDADPELVRSTDFDFDEAVRACGSLLSLPRPPTGVFAASDSQALGALEAARRAGCRIPDDLSVVSFDDTQVAATSSPPLTAVRQPFEEMGRVATQMLLAQGSAEGSALHRVELATTLVVRASTAPPAT